MKNKPQPGVQAGGSVAATTDSMRAAVREIYGSADVIHESRRPLPQIKDDEVLIRVGAAGLDRGAWHMMAGKPYFMRAATGLRRPRNHVLGLDVAGTVTAVGSDVTRFREGDEVFGFGQGSFAEYTAAKARKLALKPAGLSFAQAAVVPVSGTTALQALRDAGHVRDGQKVLVTGASGGVGSYAVQLAQAFGASVTGVCSTAKLELVRGLGADHVIDYTREDFADAGIHYDLILDFAGSPSLARLRRSLTHGGTAVIGGSEHGGNFTGLGRQFRALVISPFVPQRLKMLVAAERSQDLEQLSGFIADGRLAPCLERTFPLGQAAEAMRHLESGNVRGKVAIAP